MQRSSSLDGTWKLLGNDGSFRGLGWAVDPEADVSRLLDAQVPGEIHLDLLRHGVIDEPSIGINLLAARWVEDHQWLYRRDFQAPEDARDERVRTRLVFEGLDLAADFYLNGDAIASHRNSFVPLRVDVTGKLRPGRNVVVVIVESGLYHAGDLPATPYAFSADQSVTKRHWLRKPQYQFGWDWTRRLINVGITGRVRLEWTDAAFVDDVVTVVRVAEDLERATIQVRADADRPVDVSARIPELGVSGSGVGEAVVSVEEPELWWPSGHGDQPLFDVEIEVGEQSVRRRIGFRRVEIDQSPRPDGGRHFVLKINGRRVFCKGGNLVPGDLIPARMDRERYALLVARALEANFNMLRVWGGGLYESQNLYELCDERGILVWQECIFACSNYPADDPAFVDSVCAEVRHQVRRLSGHPSLVMWCGNNEVEWLTVSALKRGTPIDDHLFKVRIAETVGAEDPTVPYIPTSPHSPQSADANDFSEGDQHPWSVGFANPDFRDYRQMTCTFPNEGGVLGATSLPTTLASLPEGQRDIGSHARALHDNTIARQSNPGNQDKLLAFWTGLDVHSLSVDEFVYWSGLVQGEGLREYIENFRRRMFSTASAVFWMYNDCWPAVRSWTIVDGLGNRTPSFHPVRRAMAPVHVVVTGEGIFGINDNPDTVETELHHGVFTLSGRYPAEERSVVTLPPNASTRLADTPDLEDPTKQVAFASLGTGARSRLLLPTFQEMKWEPPELQVSMKDGVAVLESDRFMWGVCLDLDGDRSLPDNFFDVWPGQPFALEVAEAPRILFTGNLLAGVRGRPGTPGP